MDPLTSEEASRIQRTLHKRFLNKAFPEVQAIGIGPALKDDERDPDRPYAVCFFVRKKRTPHDRRRRLPIEVVVRIRRGKKYVSYTFPTDVVEQRPFRLTAYHVVEEGGFDSLGSVGAVIRWGKANHKQWGLLTVGHFLRKLGPITDDGPVVSVRQSTGGPGLTGQIVARTSAREAVDAAVIAIKADDLSAFGILNPATATPVTVTSVATLSGGLVGAHPQGLSLPPLPPGGKPDFRTTHFLINTGTLISGLPSLKNVIRVETDEEAFPPGTSGSMWLIEDTPTALQVAGLPPSFIQGLGQTLETQLEWIRENLELVEVPELMGYF